MQKIIDHLRENWIKHAFETAVVVVGILVAFSLTNWNEARKIATEEQEVLRLLYDDFQNSKEQSESLIDDEQRENKILSLALSSEKQVDSIFALPNSQEVAKTIFWNFQHEEPVFRAYMDLKSSGRTNIIKSQDLRSELSELEEKIQTLRYVLNDRRTVHTMRIDAMAAEEINFLPLIRENHYIVERGEASDYIALMKNQKIRNLVGIKLEIGAGILQDRHELNTQITKVIAALEKEIK